MDRGHCLSMQRYDVCEADPQRVTHAVVSRADAWALHCHLQAMRSDQPHLLRMAQNIARDLARQIGVTDA